MSKRVHIAAVGETDLPRPISLTWELVHVLAAAVAALLAWALLPQMPERIPIHFNMAGEPNGWVDKGPAAALMPVASIALLAVCLVFIHVGITRSKRAISQEAPAASSYGYAVFARAQSVSLVVLGVLVDVPLALMPLFMAGTLSADGYLALLVGACVLACVGAVWVSVCYGSNGRRVAERITGEKVVLAGVDDDSLWRWGGLYYNPEDPSVWVPKRYGIGWTINAARPLAWVEVLGFVAVLLAGGAAIALLT